MKNIALAIHGGAGPDSELIRHHLKEYEAILQETVIQGYALLEKGAPAVDAVEMVVRVLEDHPLFNAGRGSALNMEGEVEMCASIMEGNTKNAGAAAILRNVRHPISLARKIMESSDHIYLGSTGAIDFAKQHGLQMEEASWFITSYQMDQFLKKKINSDNENQLKQKHGTVGAVALDGKGSLSAGTSTGGLEFCTPGRIADSSMTGAGCYADNQTCAISTTGDGELHMVHSTAFHISALMEYRGMNLHEAAEYLIHTKCRNVKGDMGLIGVDGEGNLTVVFNSERMHRAMKSAKKGLQIGIYP